MVFVLPTVDAGDGDDAEVTANQPDGLVASELIALLGFHCCEPLPDDEAANDEKRCAGCYSITEREGQRDCTFLAAVSFQATELYGPDRRMFVTLPLFAGYEIPRFREMVQAIHEPKGRTLDLAMHGESRDVFQCLSDRLPISGTRAEPRLDGARIFFGRAACLEEIETEKPLWRAVRRSDDLRPPSWSDRPSRGLQDCRTHLAHSVPFGGHIE